MQVGFRLGRANLYKLQPIGTLSVKHSYVNSFFIFFHWYKIHSIQYVFPHIFSLNNKTTTLWIRRHTILLSVIHFIWFAFYSEQNNITLLYVIYLIHYTFYLVATTADSFTVFIPLVHAQDTCTKHVSHTGAHRYRRAAVIGVTRRPSSMSHHRTKYIIIIHRHRCIMTNRVFFILDSKKNNWNLLVLL